METLGYLVVFLSPYLIGGLVWPWCEVAYQASRRKTCEQQLENQFKRERELVVERDQYKKLSEDFEYRWRDRAECGDRLKEEQAKLDQIRKIVCEGEKECSWIS